MTNREQNSNNSNAERKDWHKTDLRGRRTSWTRIRTATGEPSAAQLQALTQLIQLYRKPLHDSLEAKSRDWAAKWGDPATYQISPSWIEQCVADFIGEKFWMKDFLKRAEPKPKSRFRDWLVTSLINYALDKARHDFGRPPRVKDGGDTTKESKAQRFYRIFTELKVEFLQKTADGGSRNGLDEDLDIPWARFVLESALETMEAACQGKRNQEIIWDIFVEEKLLVLLGKAQVEDYRSTDPTIARIQKKFSELLTSAKVSEYRSDGKGLFEDHLSLVLSRDCTSFEDIEDQRRYFKRLLCGGLRRNCEKNRTYLPDIIQRNNHPAS